MALHFQLRLNSQTLGNVEIRRVAPTDVVVPDPDTVCTYDVFRDFVVVGQVRHRYGDDAWRLVSLATELIAEEGT